MATMTEIPKPTIKDDIAAANRRSTVTGHRPDERAEVPHFESDYYKGDRIEETAAKLIATAPTLEALNGYRLVYFWRKTATKRNGRPEFGRVSKPSGLTRHLTQAADFIVEMAADECQGLDNWTFEAALFHVLCHAGEDENENERTGDITYTPGIQPHDLEMFEPELERYGFWSAELRSARGAFHRQLKLEFEAAK